LAASVTNRTTETEIEAKMKLISCISIFTLIILACNNNKVIPTIQTNGKITLIDSSESAQNLMTYDDNYRSGYFPVYYIGKLCDTIRLGQNAISDRSFGQKDYSKSKKFSWVDSAKMKIIVDTSFNLTHNVRFNHFDDKNNKEIPDSSKSYKSFAVIIYNMSDSLFSLGLLNSLGYSVRQAKNKQGNWVDIETPFSNFCGTGARNIVLEPNQVLIAKLIRQKGNFKTHCRLKFSKWDKTVYSNIYTDYISERQLTDTLEKEY